MSNPRWKTGRRRKYQARFKALGLPCALCGRPIDYSQPYYITDAEGRRHVNMKAFCIDERIPVSFWKQAGYDSPSAAADDIDNLQAAHVYCNLKKSNKLNFNMQPNKANKQEEQPAHKGIKLDGKW